MNTDTGRKIESSIENPLDDIYIRLGASLEPTFYSLGLTPNGLTGISALFGIAAIYCVTIDAFAAAGLLTFISYLFDCFDGHYARAYNMVSDFGDWFDHIKDVIVGIGMIVAVMVNGTLSWQIKAWLLGVYGILTAASGVYFGCQEAIYSAQAGAGSASLKPLRALCPDDANAAMKWARWFGSGTAVTVFSVMLAILRP
jgi:phosphatidylglycerophosphate synthase